MTGDREEILVVGTLAEPDYPAGADDTARTAAQEARIQRFREDTREQRMKIADECRGAHRPQGRVGRALRRRPPRVHLSSRSR